MSQVELLLKYQQEDSKLLKIEQEYSNSEELKNYSQTRSFLKKAPEKLELMDNKARELKLDLEKLNKKYAEIHETLQEFENLDDLVSGGADISFYKKNVAQIGDKLRGIKNEINALSNAIKDADSEYRAMKKKVLEVQEKYAKYSEIHKTYKEKKVEEMKQYQDELKNLSKDIDKEVLNKYTIKRSERIFPILCKEEGGRCSQCGSELSIADKEKLSSGKVIECDNCHRIVYKA